MFRKFTRRRRPLRRRRENDRLFVSEPLEERILLSNQTFVVTRVDDALNPDDGLTLREAILAANASPGLDRIEFGGLPDYRVQLNLPESQGGGTIRITDSVEIFGGPTLQGWKISIDGLGQMRPFQIEGTGVEVTFTDLAIRNGRATDGDGNRAQGGAIRVIGGADLTLNKMDIANNTAAGLDGSLFGSEDGWLAHGGAISIEEGNLTVIDSSFTGNRTLGGDANALLGGARGGSGVGGAIYFDSETGGNTLTIENSTFEGNRAIGGRSSAAALGGSGFGGALRVDGSGYEVAITGTTFRNNTARGASILAGINPDGIIGGPGSGGAISTLSSGDALSTTVAINSSVFEGNRAIGASGENVLIGNAGSGGYAQGGAITAGAGDWNVIDTMFIENQAIAGNGGWVSVGQAGEGGNASGGAIAVASNLTRLNLVGTLDDEIPDGESNEFKATTLFLSNMALGGSGGEKMRSEIDEDSESGSFVAFAGAGGDARGGAISDQFSVLDEPGNLVVNEVAFINNGAMAGNGGDGNLYEILPGGSNGTEREDDEFIDYVDSASAANGTATGGAIHSMANTEIADSAFMKNLAAGARFDDNLGADVASGTGGTRPDGWGGSGTDGGDAYGGAIFLDGRVGATLEVTGSGFFENQALGSSGGAGGTGGSDIAGEQNYGGDGGDGGNAAGGAIRVESWMPTRITTSVFFANSALGGLGGHGGQAGPGVNGFYGGDGGRGGDAEGGAVSFDGRRDGATLLLEEVYARDNYVLAGDGGNGGRGGGGIEYGGWGGDGGEGGSALGGAIQAEDVHVTMSQSTIEANRISSGFGGTGAYGGRAGWVGGHGGHGGNGGLAAGGGIAIDHGLLDVDHSTIAFNVVQSGFGGNGGFGNRGIVEGGNGGRGGDGGHALGGGIWASNGGSRQANLFATTVAGNAIESGGGGFGGTAGGVDFTLFKEQDTSYSRAYDPGSTSDNPAYRYEWADGIINGSAAILNGREVGSDGSTDSGGGPTLPHPPIVSGGEFILVDIYSPADESTIQLEGIGIEEAELGTLRAYDIATMSSIVGALGISGTVGVAVGVKAGLVISTGHVQAILLGAQTAAATTTKVTFAAGSALFTGSAIFAGLALPTMVGSAMLTKFLGVGIETGDWEKAFYAAIAPPAPINMDSRTLASLFPWAEEEEPEDPLDGAPDKFDIEKTNGNSGSQGTAAGAGIWATGHLDRTLVSDNATFERSRSRTLDINFNTHYQYLDVVSGNLIDVPNRYWFVEETNVRLNGADVAGTFTSAGTNFIGVANDGFDSDIHGTSADPLSANIDSQTDFNGGPLPTLELLPGSLARQAVSIDQSELSQNEFEWVGTADIGAWGAQANRAPFGHGTPVSRFQMSEDGQLTAEIAFDPDGDPITITSINLLPSHGTITFNDDETFTYTPDKDYHGKDYVLYWVSDGEFSTVIGLNITINPVAPVVTQVLVGSPTWSTEFQASLPVDSAGFYAVPNDGEQLRTLPWAINEVRIVFDENVTISQDDLNVTSSNNPLASLTTESFLLDGNVATWTLSTPVTADKLLLSLRDQAITGDDGTTGGAFQFRINVLAGDADGSGQVDSGDAVPIGAAYLTRPGDAQWNPYADLDGSGQVDAGDMAFVGAYFLNTLPTADPPPALFPQASFAAMSGVQLSEQDGLSKGTGLDSLDSGNLEYFGIDFLSTPTADKETEQVFSDPDSLFAALDRLQTSSSYHAFPSITKETNDTDEVSDRDEIDAWSPQTVGKRIPELKTSRRGVGLGKWINGLPAALLMRGQN